MSETSRNREGLLSLDHLPAGLRLKTVKNSEIVLGECIYAGDSAAIFAAASGADRVAVKIFRRPANLDYGRRSHDFFSTEMKSLTKLGHTGIIQLLDRGKFEVWPFLVIEHMDGGTLRDAIPRGGLPKAAVHSIGRQIAEAIDFAHSKGVLHGDIKPGNILLATDIYGRAALSDFGISHLFSADTTARTVGIQATFGSPIYMAPEMIAEERAGVSADIYSFGMVLFEMIVGKCPFPDATNAFRLHALKNDPPALLRSFHDQLGQPLFDVFTRVMEVKPEKRPKTAGALMADVSRALSD